MRKTKRRVINILPKLLSVFFYEIKTEISSRLLKMLIKFVLENFINTYDAFRLKSQFKLL